MERLMVVKLASQGCTAELWLNGLPVARVTPLAPDVVVPVHEAAVTGRNRLELVIDPTPAPLRPRLCCRPHRRRWSRRRICCCRA